MLIDRFTVGREAKVLLITQNTIEGAVAAWVAEKKLLGNLHHEVIDATTKPESFTAAKVNGIQDKHVLVAGVPMPAAVLEHIQRTAKGCKFLYNVFGQNRANGLKELKFQMHVSLGAMMWTFLGMEEAKPWITDWSDVNENWRWKGVDKALLTAYIREHWPITEPHGTQSIEVLSKRDLSSLVQEAEEWKSNFSRPGSAPKPLKEPKPKTINRFPKIGRSKSEAKRLAIQQKGKARVAAGKK